MILVESRSQFRRNEIAKIILRSVKNKNRRPASGGRLEFPTGELLFTSFRGSHVGGSFSTSMAPWHLHSQVAASFSRQLLMLIARYQAAAKQSTEDIEVSPSPAEPNTFGFSLTEGSYSESIAGQAPPPPSSPSRSRDADRLVLAFVVLALLA
jgi:hypothetical protein